MEARDLAETLKDLVLPAEQLKELGADALLHAETSWGYGDADFFIQTEDDGKFLVSVVKVAE
jgi:hypothetical protein